MDLRVLRYFIVVAQVENITRAANILNITQPTLSRQLSKLEEDLGCNLLIRGKRKVLLTDDGQLLLQRAEEIITLVDKTINEFKHKNEVFSGEVMIGSIEGDTTSILSQSLSYFNRKYPLVTYNIFSGTGEEIKDKIDKGIIDFGIVLEPIDLDKYECFQINSNETWGILTRNDSTLSNKKVVTSQDLTNHPLMIPSRPFVQNSIIKWLGADYDSINITNKYNLIFNTASLVEQGLGNAMCLEGVTNVAESRTLTFVPLDPPMYSKAFVIWRKHKLFSPSSKELLNHLAEYKIK